MLQFTHLGKIRMVAFYRREIAFLERAIADPSLLNDSSADAVAKAQSELARLQKELTRYA